MNRRVTLDNPPPFMCGNRTTRPEEFGSVFMSRGATGGFGFWFDRAAFNFACNFQPGHGPQAIGEDLMLHGWIFKVADWTDREKALNEARAS